MKTIYYTYKWIHENLGPLLAKEFMESLDSTPGPNTTPVEELLEEAFDALLTQVSNILKELK